MEAEVVVAFHPEPYSFSGAQGCADLWKAPERQLRGVYLWCIALGTDYLINDVGKTWGAGGFEGRLRQELKDYRKGLYATPTEAEGWLEGVRRVRRTPPTAEEATRRRQAHEGHYRIFMAPLASHEEARGVESELVGRLRAVPEAWQFLSNRDKDRGYRRRVALLLADPPRLIGLTVPVPDRLRESLKRYPPLPGL